MTPTHYQSRYRADIDGLRAIAVIAVIFYHYFPDWVRGGYVGVDVFFVISGYLITAGILANLRRDQFRFADFYNRRVRRIFPALAIILATCLVFGWGALTSDEFEQLGKHTAGGAGFISNLLFWKESSYFGVGSDLKPLLHLWSLGIEEQFYILWPILLVLSSLKRVRFSFVCGSILASSFAACLYLTYRSPTAAFFSPFSRYWELLAGAALAGFELDAIRTPRKGQLFEALGVIGTAALVIAFASFDQSVPYPGWRALLPTFGAVLFIAAGPQARLNRLLSKKGIVAIGLISYSLYLWHWPIIVFARILYPDALIISVRIGLALAAVVLASITYVTVERPFRLSMPWTSAKGATLALASIAFIALLIFYSGGFPGRDNARNEYARYFENSPPDFAFLTHNRLFALNRDECNFVESRTVTVRPQISATCYTPASPRRIFVWGDSYAEHLYHGLSLYLPKDVSVLQVTSSGCWPHLSDQYPDEFNACNKSNRFALQKIREIKPQIVLLSQIRDHERNDYDAIAKYLNSLGVKQVVLLGPTPQWNPMLYKVVLRKYWKKTPPRIAANLISSIFVTDRLMKERYGGSHILRYISALDEECNADGCIAYYQNNRREGLVTFDNGHMTPLASEELAKTILVPVLQGYL